MRGRVPRDACAGGNHLQEHDRCSFDRDAGESSTPDSAGVDVDSIRADVGMRNRCVAVNDQSAVIEPRVEKLAADPDQIMELLSFERNAWTDSGMNEQQASATKPGFQALQEQQVRAGEHPAKSTVQIPAGLAAMGRWNDAIRCESLKASQLRPCLEMHGIAKELLHQVLVIAAKTNGTMVNESNGEQVDHCFRVGAAIDVIAEIDFHTVADRPAFQIFVDAFDGFDQKIGATMYIPDRVDARIRRRRSGNPA